MKNGRTVSPVLLVVLTFVLLATAEGAPKLTFKFTTIEVKGAQDTRVFGTNDAGVMVGAYVDSSGVDHGFMLKGGKVTTLDDSKGTTTNCLGINLAGDLVGYYLNSSGAVQAFLRHGKKFTDIGPTGATSSEAFARPGRTQESSRRRSARSRSNAPT